MVVLGQGVLLFSFDNKVILIFLAISTLTSAAIMLIQFTFILEMQQVHLKLESQNIEDLNAGRSKAKILAILFIGVALFRVVLDEVTLVLWASSPKSDFIDIGESISPFCTLVYNFYFLLVCAQNIKYFVQRKKESSPQESIRKFLMWVTFLFIINTVKIVSPLFTLLNIDGVESRSIVLSIFNFVDACNCISILMLVYYVGKNTKKLNKLTKGSFPQSSEKSIIP